MILDDSKQLTMSFHKTIVYTEPARERLEAFRRRLDAEFEDVLRQRRSIPGDDQIEVTASDIEALARSWQWRHGTHGVWRRAVRSLILRAYTLLGVVMAAAGLLYPYRERLLADPIPAWLVATGLGTAAIGYLLQSFLASLDVGEHRNPHRDAEVDMILQETESY